MKNCEKPQSEVEMHAAKKAMQGAGKGSPSSVKTTGLPLELPITAQEVKRVDASRIEMTRGVKQGWCGVGVVIHRRRN